MELTELPPMVSRSQAAEYLGVTPQALSAMDVRGAGPTYVRIGRVVRYPREDFVAWIEAHTVRRFDDDQRELAG
jgi:hypothetical protein